jgi:superfamily I DNA and RNA helicase
MLPYSPKYTTTMPGRANPRQYVQQRTRTTQFQRSFFPDSIKKWNSLFAEVLAASSISILRNLRNMSATAFGFFHMFFPTIILTFAYPTQIIVIFTFVVAYSYMFATSIFSASIIKLYGILKHDSSSNESSDQEKKNSQRRTKQLLAKLLKVVFVG